MFATSLSHFIVLSQVRSVGCHFSRFVEVNSRCVFCWKLLADLLNNKSTLDAQFACADDKYIRYCFSSFLCLIAFSYHTTNKTAVFKQHFLRLQLSPMSILCMYVFLVYNPLLFLIFWIIWLSFLIIIRLSFLLILQLSILLVSR